MCVAHSSALLNWRLLLSNDLLLKVAHRVAFLVVSLGVLHVPFSIAEMNMKLKYHIAKHIVLAGKPVTLHRCMHREMHASDGSPHKHVSAADNHNPLHRRGKVLNVLVMVVHIIILWIVVVVRDCIGSSNRIGTSIVLPTGKSSLGIATTIVYAH